MINFTMNFKNILRHILFLCIFIPVSSFAIEIYVDKEITQGSTLEIRIPTEDISQVSGNYDGTDFNFYIDEKIPHPSEKISRGEFLKLVFDSGSTLPTDYVLREVNFQDVDKSDPLYPYIQKAIVFKILTGFEDGNFRPYEPISRGEAAQVLINTFNPRSFLSSQTYSDLPEDHHFYDYLTSAVQAKIFLGYPDGLIRPERPLSYQEAKIIIQRASGPTKKIESREYWRALVGISRIQDPGMKRLTLKITNKNGTVEEKSLDIHVSPRHFETVSFTVPKSQNKLFKKKSQNNTWEMINDARLHSTAKKLWNGKFLIPAEGEPTLGYGDLLHINGKYNGSHFGHDIANTEGTSIYAANAGRVVLSDYTPSYGNSIIIDHGQNIFTMYLHLSERIAVEGQYVHKGELIGLMGKTGIATGSHLHYSHWVGEVIVDGEEWWEKEY